MADTQAHLATAAQIMKVADQSGIAFGTLSPPTALELLHAKMWSKALDLASRGGDPTKLAGEL